jgi:hypothetical protein
VGEDILHHVGRRNPHAVEEICQHALIVKANLFLVIGGGGQSVQMPCHLDNMYHPFALLKRTLKTHFFSVLIHGEPEEANCT